MKSIETTYSRKVNELFSRSESANTSPPSFTIRLASKLRRWDPKEFRTMRGTWVMSMKYLLWDNQRSERFLHLQDCYDLIWPNFKRKNLSRLETVERIIWLETISDMRRPNRSEFILIQTCNFINRQREIEQTTMISRYDSVEDSARDTMLQLVQSYCRVNYKLNQLKNLLEEYFKWIKDELTSSAAAGWILPSSPSWLKLKLNFNQSSIRRDTN